MTVFKCKMCGGTLEISNNETVATCEYCGTQQTLPKLDDERRVNLYDRANHFRRNNEFDKAMGIYEKILNENGTDSEAYWSLVLCRYGIEYVEDPSSNKRIPTVNRAQFTSIFDDDNYKSALQYADIHQRSLYEEEAKMINEIQKGILAISQKEEPFDVFVCYKESDSNGRRTPDSVLANDLYHQLTQEGFKVFFARITLEDKLGSAYEPYIFAALNSAKVMVILGTKPEYFNAVWVKNEWSRYLALIKQGQKKMLIPAYKDMDPYDLPEEFSHLQAQDMSKLGFMQDLIRGIKKIIGADVQKTTVVRETIVATETANQSNTAPLLKRAFMFLEDGDFNSANDYCEKVLDIDPECAEAYLGKLMADSKVKKQEDLKDLEQPFDSNGNYQKVIRFADEKLKSELIGYIEYIEDRNENARLEGIYVQGKYAMNNSKNNIDYQNTANLFKNIIEYKDSAELAKKCEELALDYTYSIGVARMNQSDYKGASKIFESIKEYKDSSELLKQCDELEKKEAIYKEGNLIIERAKSIRQKDGESELVIKKYKDAIFEFEKIKDYKDANEKITYCKEKIEETKTTIEENRIEKEKKAKAARERNKKIAIIAVASICVIVSFIILLNYVIIPNGKYSDALDLMKSGKYIEAISAFEALEGYRDSEDKIEECKKLTLVAPKIGDYVCFGEYEQDNKESNGSEAIEWLVLDKQDNKMLVVSKYALDCKRYHEALENITWEDCTLRTWLNNDFINAAFSKDEKAKIPTVTVVNDDNQDYDTDGGNDTQDKVFLLSIDEVNKYFDSDEERMCDTTDYVKAQGAYTSYTYTANGKTTCCWWWLRSPGRYQNSPAGVYSDGSVYESGFYVFRDDSVVRPALWINIE